MPLHFDGTTTKGRRWGRSVNPFANWHHTFLLRSGLSMDDSFDASLEFTLAEEGGYIDHPTDARFATNFGITLARLRRFLREPSLGRDDVKHIACTTVRAVYMADYWNRTRCDALPPG